MAGRRPKPTVLKVLTGNFRPDRAKKGEPRPDNRPPECPEHLNAGAKAAWRSIGPELERMGVLTVADGLALQMLCEAYADYREASDVLARKGATYETTTAEGSTMIRPRPELALASDSWKRVRAMLIEFGLTPAARTRVTVIANRKPNAFDEF